MECSGNSIWFVKVNFCILSISAPDSLQSSNSWCEKKCTMKGAKRSQIIIICVLNACDRLHYSDTEAKHIHKDCKFLCLRAQSRQIVNCSCCHLYVTNAPLLPPSFSIQPSIQPAPAVQHTITNTRAVGVFEFLMIVVEELSVFDGQA
jgi:hypothetical protein